MYPSFAATISVRLFSPSHLTRRACECCSYRHQLDGVKFKHALIQFSKLEEICTALSETAISCTGHQSRKPAKSKRGTDMSEYFIFNLNTSLKILEPIDMLITMFRAIFPRYLMSSKQMLFLDPLYRHWEA
jgi:hypothetical protein